MRQRTSTEEIQHVVLDAWNKEPRKYTEKVEKHTEISDAVLEAKEGQTKY